jgi:hypothetical protein
VVKFHIVADGWQNCGFGNAAESTIAHYLIDCPFGETAGGISYDYFGDMR